MLTRRSLLTGGLLAAPLARTDRGTPAAADASPQGSRGGNADEQVVKVLEEIRDAMRGSSGVYGAELTAIRSLQREFLKGHGKFPDFVEIGIDVWDSVMTWHVRTRQQPLVTRMGDGRYSVAFLQSNLVLRHDVSGSYVGQPFDAK